MYALLKDGEKCFRGNPFATLRLAWEFAVLIDAIEQSKTRIWLKEGYIIEEVKE